MIDVINYFGVLFCKTEANVLKAPRERESLSSSIDSEIHIKNDFDTRKWEKSGFLALLIIGTDRCGVAIVIHYNANKQTSLKLWICNGVFQVYGEIANVLSIHCLNMKEVKIMRRKKMARAKIVFHIHPGLVCVCVVYIQRPVLERC